MVAVKRILTIAGILLSSLLPAASAAATTQTARAGGVVATFSFTGTFPSFGHQQLVIDRNGKVAYENPVSSPSCGTLCEPASTSPRAPSVQVLDIEDNGLEDVLLNLYSGGAHCCFITQIFSLDQTTMTYVKTERNFGDPGDTIRDLGHNGHDEFLTANDAFAYAFTDYAASGLPIEILSFSDRRFRNVTRSYPALIRKDAELWLGSYKDTAADHWQDSIGLIAAWAADEDMLGHSATVSSYLSQQASAGHLNSPLAPGGERFVAALQRFLRQQGYLSGPQ